MKPRTLLLVLCVALLSAAAGWLASSWRMSSGVPNGTVRWIEMPPWNALDAESSIIRSNLQVVFVTGAFSECFGESARPFARAVDELGGRGDRFDTIVVGGRSGDEHNAAQIFEYFRDRPVEPGPIEAAQDTPDQPMVSMARAPARPSRSSSGVTT